MLGPLRRVTRLATSVARPARVAALSTEGGSTKLWGGRFARDTDDAIKGWADSTPIDSTFANEDMWGSMAHVAMLGCTATIPADDACKILGGLLECQDGFDAGEWELRKDREDVHLNVEGRLIDMLGMDVAGKMHTTRSRNDQVALDARMMTRRPLLELRERLGAVAESFLDRADEYGDKEDVMVSYTHFQHAQPVSISFWLQHYAAAFLRDMERCAWAYDQADQNPLGGGAISGTSFPIDREMTTRLLGFQQVMENTLDATSGRDYMLDVLHASATFQSTASRLAEEFIMWSSYEFRTVTLDDGFAMGSSMMPQKKNPGALELIRGRSGRQTGLLVGGYTMLKGLPSGYNRDFHEEKELLYRSLKMATACAEVIPAFVKSTQINKERMHDLTYGNFASATELANYLVRDHGTPFREAHHIVGSFVGDLTRKGENFRGNTDACVQHLADRGVVADREEVRRALEPAEIVASYNCQGGTGPIAVAAAQKLYRQRLADLRAGAATDRARHDSAYAVCRAIAGEAKALSTREELQALVAKHSASLENTTL